MTSVHAINHTTVSSKFHSLNEITWELEHGVPSRAKSHTLSCKTRPARKHPPNQCTQTDTHTHSYTHTVKAVSLSPSMALCSLQQNHLITRQIQSVITAHTDWGLHTFLFCAIQAIVQMGVLRLHVRLRACSCVCLDAWLPAEMVEPGDPQGRGFTGAINNRKWHVPSVLCPQLHWAYLFCGCLLQSRPLCVGWSWRWVWGGDAAVRQRKMCWQERD